MGRTCRNQPLPITLDNLFSSCPVSCFLHFSEVSSALLPFSFHCGTANQLLWYVQTQYQNLLFSHRARVTERFLWTSDFRLCSYLKETPTDTKESQPSSWCLGCLTSTSNLMSSLRDTLTHWGFACRLISASSAHFALELLSLTCMKYSRGLNVVEPFPTQCLESYISGVTWRRSLETQILMIFLPFSEVDALKISKGEDT